MSRIESKLIVAAAAALALLAVSACRPCPPSKPHAKPACEPQSISQDCALNGCFAGDSPGFPVTVSQPGSYSLCGNLVVADANTTGIEVTANHVTIDFMGFAISGPVVCSKQGENPLTCSATGTGNGVDANGMSNVVLHDGTVQGMGKSGIIVGPASRVERLQVLSNGENGIQFDSDTALIADNMTLRNGQDGIMGMTRSIIRGNVTAHNGNNGISTQEYCLVSENNASRNGGDGIVSGCVATIVDNKATGNANNGITTCGAATVTRNSSHENGGAALQIGGGSCGENTLSDNSISGNCTFIGPNVCGNAPCP